MGRTWGATKRDRIAHIGDMIGAKRLRGSPPLPWFLPGANPMREGAARRLASASGFHRGVQPEASLQQGLRVMTIYQKVGTITRSWGGFLAESSEARFRKPV